MKSIYSLLITLTMFVAVQSLQSATFTVQNESDYVLIVTPLGGKGQVYKRIRSGEKKDFNSGARQVDGIQWAELASSSNDNSNAIHKSGHVFEVTAQNKKPPHNKIFLRRSHRGGTFKIKNDGHFSYKLGSDGYGSGSALCVD